MDTTITLAELQRRHVEIHAHEAVAIARKLMRGRLDNAEARPPYGPPSIDTVAIDRDGSVHCRGTAATPSVPEVAIVLQTLLAQTESRVPGGLRYAVGRALLEVEAPPFDSLEDFSTALARFERDDAGVAIAALHTRAAISAARNIQHDEAAHGDHERRQHGPSATELRRQLREADLRLFEAQQSMRAEGRAWHASRSSRRAPIAACMIAGVALVAVGELARTGHIGDSDVATSRATPITDNAAALQPRIELAATTRSGAPDAVSAPRSAHVPTDASAPDTQQRRPRADRYDPPRVTQRARTVRARTVRTAATRTGTNEPPVRRSRSLERQRRGNEHDDRGVLARIRFEWDNPFR